MHMNGNQIQTMKKISINKIITLSITVIVLALGIIFNNQNKNINEKASSDTKLFISPSSQDAHVNDSFTVQIGLDSGTNKVTGIDLVVKFDPKVVQINEVKATAESANLNTIIKNEIDNSTGKIRYVAFTADKSLALSGNLKILTLNGRISQTSSLGNSEISIDPTSLVSATGEGQNVLLESIVGVVKVTEKENIPNSCGGTCGSNFNCQANLYCYAVGDGNQGYCRNPQCSDKADCNCPSPTTPPTQNTVVKTVTKTIVITVTPQAEPQRIDIAESSPSNQIDTPTISPYYEPEASPEETIDNSSDKSKLNLVRNIILTTLFLILIVISIVIWKNNKNNKPHILPPTNI